MAKKKPSKLSQAFEKYRGRKPGNNLKEPLWNLDRDGVTFSMISRFLNCRESFRLSAVEGWTSKNIKVPLEFGSAFHKCMEHVESGGKVDDIKKVTKSYQRSREQDRNARLTADDLTDLERVMGMVERTYYHYFDYWSQVATFQSGRRSYYDSDINYVYQEEPFDVYHVLPNGRKVRLRGRWDAVFKHPITKKLALQENKTKERIDEYAILHGLKKDLQTQFYLWSIYLVEGQYPRHVLYNVIRRPGLRPGVKETLVEFLQRIDEDIEKRPDHYFMRWDVELEPKDLIAFRDKTLNPLLTTICEWWDSIKHDPFSPWTLADGKQNMLHFERPFGIYDSAQFGNGMGDFYSIRYNDLYDGYYQREMPFPELEDEE